MRYAVGVLAAVLAVGADGPAPNPLLGDWAVVSADGGGELGRRLKANVARVQIDAERITAGRPAEYTLDAGKKQIDLTIDAGPAAERGVYRGVYELTDGTLKLCLALPGKPRPAGPTASPDAVLLVLGKGKR
jgi:uncharacterized protein (TIGR03067 family)